MNEKNFVGIQLIGISCLFYNHKTSIPICSLFFGVTKNVITILDLFQYMDRTLSKLHQGRPNTKCSSWHCCATSFEDESRLTNPDLTREE